VLTRRNALQLHSTDGRSWVVCAGLGVFQDVTMRIIAERVVVPDAGGTTYVDHELINQKLKGLPPPSATHHVYISKANLGAVEVMTELANERTLELVFSHKDASRTSSRRPFLTDESRKWWHKIMGTVTHEVNSMLKATTELADLSECDHMLLYLNAQTWTEEVRRPTRLRAKLGRPWTWACTSCWRTRVRACAARTSAHDGRYIDTVCFTRAQCQDWVDRHRGMHVSSTASSHALRVRPPHICCNRASTHKLLWL
jgi:hypothetical protein